MFSLPWENWLRLAVWLVLGLVIYFCYGRRHSVMRSAQTGEEADATPEEEWPTPVKSE